MKFRGLAAFGAALTLLIAVTHATEPGEDGSLPPAYLDRLNAKVGSLNFRRSLLQLPARASAARQLQLNAALSNESRNSLAATMGLIAPSGEYATKVAGNRQIPVILLKFSDTGNTPYAPADLKTELFTGPWPTGTLTSFYTDLSAGALTVSGSISAWTTLPLKGSDYAGADYQQPPKTDWLKCYGFCANAKLGQLITDALDRTTGFNWGDYDNDGPDNKPNSGDDDGYVDFVAFVQPGRGGECTTVPNNRNIWSHRGNLTDLIGHPYVTKSKKKGGGFIAIDDYVIVPALACDGTTMIQIGVFAHEFGHAFGLPDLYDTSQDGKSAGVGNWCLMAGGAWGGDGHSPQTPSRMSAWALSFLGWIDVKEVTADTPDLPITPVQTSHTAWQVPISGSQYYLLSHVTQTGFDKNLPTAGLEVWKINRTVIDATLRNNQVNADLHNRGVELEEADGSHGLDQAAFRGGAGDLFVGTAHRTTFDHSTDPGSIGPAALCDIQDSSPVHLRVSLSSNACAQAQAAPSAPLAAAPPAVGAPTFKSGTLIKDLDALPNHALVQLRGRIENKGRSLFDHTRHLVLTDQNGKDIDVKLSLPVETPAPLPGQTKQAPTTLTQVLGHEVIVTGMFHQANEQGTKLPAHIEISTVTDASK